ncbi:MAG: hypothetical protein R2932_12955 [Caldilineaceae bacterium]
MPKRRACTGLSSPKSRSARVSGSEGRTPAADLDGTPPGGFGPATAQLRLRSTPLRLNRASATP